MAAEYKRHYRNWQKLKAGTRKPELSLDMEMPEDSMTLGDQLSTEETPETFLLVKESFLGHRAAFRLNKDPSGVTKRLKRAAHRLKENIEKNF